MAKNSISEVTGWSTFPLEKSLGCFKGIWDKLNAELYVSHPYFDSDFVEPMLAFFSAGKERICIHRGGMGVDGLLIVMPVGLGRWSLFVPSQAQVVPVLVRHPDDLQSLVHALPQCLFSMDLLCQDGLYKPSFDTIQTLLWGPIRHTHTMGVKLDGEFNDYWRERPGNLRKNVSRRFRKVQKAGLTIRLNRLSESADMQAAIARFGEMESVGWKGRCGTAVHSDNVQGGFYVEVLRRFSTFEKATIYELYFNDELVAMQLCIASPSMLVLLKTTYDERQAVFSPGRLLLYALLEKEFADKRVQEIEFYTDADSEQLAWATDDRWISHYMLFRNGMFRKIYTVTKRLGLWADGLKNKGRDE